MAPAADDPGQRAEDETRALLDERRFRDAVGPAAEACRLRPDSAAAWWHQGVVQKHVGQWRACLDACDRAIALAPDDSAGPRWNAGIAATALGDWPRARAAWRAYGIDVPPGEGPLTMKLGVVCVRVAPSERAEVVWCARFDPCRARVLSVPQPASGRRFGDIVLHDGERRGSRALDGRDVPVFDELMVLEPSSYRTWIVDVICADPAALAALVARFDDVDGTIEDWTDSLQVLCAACSLGTPHAHDPDDEPGGEVGDGAAWQPARQLGLALRDERDLDRARDAAGRWLPGIRTVTCAL